MYKYIVYESIKEHWVSFLFDMSQFARLYRCLQEVKNLHSLLSFPEKKTGIQFCLEVINFLAKIGHLASYEATVINTVRGQALFRSYGRLFAEFLDEESLVHLGLLDLSTCVGLRYGRRYT